MTYCVCDMLGESIAEFGTEKEAIAFAKECDQLCTIQYMF